MVFKLIKIFKNFHRKCSSISSIIGTSKEPNSFYDVIIIGGGHNGLVAASYLSKNKLKVCVLERRHILGGAAVTEEIIPGFKFSRASYLLSLIRPKIIKDLQLYKHGLKLYMRNPSSYTPLIKSKWTSKYTSLTLGIDRKQNEAAISKFSLVDARKFIEYENELNRFIQQIDPLFDISPHTLQKLFDPNISSYKKLLMTKSADIRKVIYGFSKLGSSLKFGCDMIFCPATTVLEKWFESEPLKATLLTDACIGTMLSPTSIGSGYTLLHHMMGDIDGIKGSWAYVEGGMGNLSAAIASSALSHGAQIFTNKEVTNITLDMNDNVEGVITKDGYHIKSSNVLSNATPEVTFMNLLPPAALDPKFLKSINNLSYTSSVTKINALNKIPNFEANPNECEVMPHHQSTIHINCESMENILQAHNEASQGLLPKKPMIEMTIPSSLDPTLCPPGFHVCSLFVQYTSYQLKNGQQWDDQTKFDFANSVFNCIEDYSPLFKESIIGYEVLSPVDLKNIFGLTGGNIFHGDLSLNQLLFNRSVNWNNLYSPYTPIKGLLLCGSGAHPGGGVTGAPGRLAALELIENLRRNK